MTIRKAIAAAVNSRWATPLKVGVVAGMCIGLATAVGVVCGQQYLPHHLYKTTATVSALSADRWAALAIIAVYLLFLLVLAERPLNRMTRIVVNVLLVGGAFAAVAIRWGIIDAVRGIGSISSDKFFLRAAVAGIRWELLAVGVVLVVLVVVLKRVHAKDEQKLDLRVTAELAARLARSNALFLCFLTLLVLVNLTAGILTVRAASSVKDKPNIVVIMVCSLRADHLSCYGYKHETSPNIDRLAGQGTRFTRAIAQAPWTRPSVASFLSSQYPQALGMEILRVEDRFVMMAEALKEHGYTTAAVTSNYNAGRSVNVAQGFGSFAETATEMDISSPEVADKAIERIARLRQERFFMFLMFSDPHSPYFYHRDHALTVIPGLGDRAVFDSRMPELITPEDMPGRLAAYDSEIHFTDYHIGRVIEELRKRGLYDNTLIVFAGDHGEGFGEHGFFDHGNTLYEELTHVPLIVKLPGQKQGRVAAGPFPLMDVFPSVMATAGCDASHYGLEGARVSLRTPPEDRAGCMFSATFFETLNLRAAQKGPYKLIVNMKSPERELYDLSVDPAEKHNILSAERAVAADLGLAILCLENRTADQRSGAGPTNPAEVFKPNELERLRSLGYLK